MEDHELINDVETKITIPTQLWILLYLHLIFGSVIPAVTNYLHTHTEIRISART